MGVKSKRRKTTAADLPEEVPRNEILTRLPIKSAVRFKSVSKSWLSLFSNPQFVKQHHIYNSTQNPNAHDLLIADKVPKLVILSRYKETNLLSLDKDLFLVGSIHGLVCLYRGLNLSLWNPAIRQSKEFRLPRSHFGVPGTSIGFGFDSVRNDFKDVVLGADFSSASVYCSGLDCWSEVGVEEDVFPKIEFEDDTPTFIVSGRPYWTRSRYVYNTITEEDGKECTYLGGVFLSLVEFDPLTYEFSVSPEYHWDREDYGGLYGGGGYEFCYQFVDLMDHVTLIVHDRNSSSCVVEMFSLVGEVGCCAWKKMCTVGMFDFETPGWYVSLTQGFKYDSEIVFHGENGMFACIDPKTEEIKRLSGSTSTEYDVTCYRYTPTLFFIQGMKSVHLTSQTRTPRHYRTPRRLISSLRDKSCCQCHLDV